MSDLLTWIAASGRTDAEVGVLVGCSQATISRIKRGVGRASPDLAVRLEALTGIAAWEFVKPISPDLPIGEGPVHAAQPAALSPAGDRP